MCGCLQRTSLGSSRVSFPMLCSQAVLDPRPSCWEGGVLGSLLGLDVDHGDPESRSAAGRDWDY
jgi:hypothetical protein